MSVTQWDKKKNCEGILIENMLFIEMHYCIIMGEHEVHIEKTKPVMQMGLKRNFDWKHDSWGSEVGVIDPAPWRNSGDLMHAHIYMKHSVWSIDLWAKSLLVAPCDLD